METVLKNLFQTMESFKKNAETQFQKNNKSAGVRARKDALNLMKDLKAFRRLSVEFSKNVSE